MGEVTVYRLDDSTCAKGTHAEVLRALEAGGVMLVNGVTLGKCVRLGNGVMLVNGVTLGKCVMLGNDDD